MKNEFIQATHSPYPRRRRLLWIAAILPALFACARASGGRAASQGANGAGNRFAGIPIGTLRLDANPEKRGVTIYDDKGFSIGAGSLLSLKNVKNYSFPGGERGLPKSIRATWLTGNFASDSNGKWTGGTVIGDYTVPVADRIPDALLDHIRRQGGSLRVKIRIVDDGVLIGWDVEKIVYPAGWKSGDGPGSVQYTMAGGDFREDQIINGVVVEPGWQHPPANRSNAARHR